MAETKTCRIFAISDFILVSRRTANQDGILLYNPLEFLIVMATTSDHIQELERAFFPVVLKPLVWLDNAEEMQDDFNSRPLFGESQRPYTIPFGTLAYKLPRHFAIVRYDNKYVYQCVTENYELVTNEDAVEWSLPIVEKVFKCKSIPEFEAKFTPKVGLSHTNDAVCYIYFSSNEAFFDGIEDDQWVMFMVVSNSYDSTTALQYEFGFRIINTDTFIIFDELSIDIKDAHSKGIENHLPEMMIRQITDKQLDHSELVKERFIEKMSVLYNMYIDNKDIFPLAFKLFEMKDKTESDKNNCRGLVQAIERYLVHGKFLRNNAYDCMKLAAFVTEGGLEGFYQRYDQTSFAFKYQHKIGKLIDELYSIANNRKTLLKNLIGNEYYQMAYNSLRDYSSIVDINKYC